MATEFEKLSPQAQKELHDLDHLKASLLAIGATHARDREMERGYPADPKEALMEARKLAGKDVQLSIDSPVCLVIDLIDIAVLALDHPSFDDSKALANVLSTAGSALFQWREQDKEVQRRLRAITHPSR